MQTHDQLVKKVMTRPAVRAEVDRLATATRAQLAKYSELIKKNGITAE